MFHRLQYLLITNVVTTLLAVLGLPSQSQDVDRKIWEDRIKATMIFKFVFYVHWPSPSVNSNSEHIVIGVFNDDIQFGLLSNFVGRKVENRKILVKRVATVDDSLQCQVVFFGADAGAAAEPILSTIRDQAILTIGEHNDFLADGGIINFYVDDQDRVQFKVNAGAAEGASLKISSRLLKIAKAVIRQNQSDASIPKS